MNICAADDKILSAHWEHYFSIHDLLNVGVVLLIVDVLPNGDADVYATDDDEEDRLQQREEHLMGSAQEHRKKCQLQVVLENNYQGSSFLYADAEALTQVLVIRKFLVISVWISQH